jgi:hypothetical protein
MFIAMLQHTPAWVWGLFVALAALGLAQARPREMSLPRVTILPLAMLALSLSGVFQSFGHFPVALGGWAAGVGAALAFARGRIDARGAEWRAARGTLFVPGSWLPLVLIVGLFALKYAAGVTLALEPARAADPLFAGVCSLAYGSFSGLFLARGLALRRIAALRPPFAAA